MVQKKFRSAASGHKTQADIGCNWEHKKHQELKVLGVIGFPFSYTIIRRVSWIHIFWIQRFRLSIDGISQDWRRKNKDGSKVDFVKKIHKTKRKKKTTKSGFDISVFYLKKLIEICFLKWNPRTHLFGFFWKIKRKTGNRNNAERALR